MDIASVSPALPVKPPRVLSVDVLRGITMFAMVFVNDAAGAKGLPWWLKHWEKGSGMTFVDVVFPAFLFLAGMSIPLAVESRRGREPWLNTPGVPWWKSAVGWLKIYGHVILRTLSLLFIGILMVNNPSAKAMGWENHSGLWQVLMYGGVILAFHWLPLKRPIAQYISLGVRVLGLALLVFLAIKFRSRNGEPIEHSWWGILGLIGWAYFGATTVYLLLRKEGIWALMTASGLFMAVYFADKKGTFGAVGDWKPFSIPVGDWLDIASAFGSHASITMAGAALGSLLLPASERPTPGSKIRFALVFSALMCAGAMLLNRYGISKNNATLSWCMWSCAITASLWAILYAIIDVAGVRFWAIPLAWAGANALLIYIISEGLDSYRGYFNLDWKWYDDLGRAYPAALYHKFLTAGAIALFAGVVGRLGFRLRL